MEYIEAVIFDWAGTTVDFAGLASVTALVDVFADFGVALTMAEARMPQGDVGREYMAALLAVPAIGERFRRHHGRDYTEADINAIDHAYEQKLLNNLSSHAEPKPYVLQTVSSLREEGIKTAVVIDHNRTMMAAEKAAAAAQGLAPDCWSCAEDAGGMGRPYPYILFAAMQKMAIREVGNVITVGDTAADIQAGLAAGMWTVGVVEGSVEMGLSTAEYHALDAAAKAGLKEQVAATFWSYGADFVIDDISEIFEVIRLIETDLEEELDD